MDVQESTVSIVAEDSPNTGNPITECMEDRDVTFTATARGFVSTIPGNNIDFTFFFQQPDGTPYSESDWSWDLIEDHDKDMEQVLAGDPDHYYDTPIRVTAQDNFTHQAASEQIEIRVWELWIEFFRDLASGKDWKVIVGQSIVYKAISAQYCKNWNWDMPDGWPDAWNPTGGNAKQGTMTIPNSDMPSDNDDFGSTYGTVKVFCEDEEGNNHTFYSTSMGNKAEVFFNPTAFTNPGGNSPNWFYYWNQTSAGSSSVSYNSSAGMGVTTAYGTTIGGKRKITGVDAPLIGPGTYGSDTLGGNSTCNEGTFNGGVISGIDLFHIVVQHEMLHYSDVSSGIDKWDDDSDWLHNDMELDLNTNGTWDPGETNPNDDDTHNLSCPSTDIDAEYRTYRAEVTDWAVDIGNYDNVDWSQNGKQW
jgi:hypothetical protein